jgi:acyl-CoA hydrolase
MVYLAKKGVITGKQWAAFALGTQELYEYVGNGPVQFAPISIINDPVEIGKNKNFVSINACLSTDLTGQVCSEAIGPRQYSATGGQLDYVRGAAMSEGGKSFLCLASTRTDKSGKLHSKIEVSLPPGSIITTPRADVMYIATEYGVADIYLKTVEDRVNAMISIAHPDFRDELRAGAIREGIIRK